MVTMIVDETDDVYILSAFKFNLGANRYKHFPQLVVALTVLQYDGIDQQPLSLYLWREGGIAVVAATTKPLHSIA